MNGLYRFQQTYIGTVVVSVNPYRDLPIYSQDVIEKYRGENLYELPPHMYVHSEAIVCYPLSQLAYKFRVIANS